MITQLPAAAYSERTAADKAINSLRPKNSNLKQRLALEALAVRQPPRPPSPPRSSWQGRGSGHNGGFNDWRDFEATRTFTTCSSVTSRHDSIYTPPLPKALLPHASRPSLKRPRTETPPPLLKRPLPVCTGCFQNGSQCDGRLECSACRGRAFRCEYNECWETNYCTEAKCTRLHPEQWSGNEESGRIVKTKRR